MSMISRFNHLRSSIWSRFPARPLNQDIRLSYGKLCDPTSYGERHFTTGVQTLGTKLLETNSWCRTDPGSEYDQHQPATVLVFDVETTGYLHPSHRITELALCDLSGGKNSTFETLINPEREIPGYVEKLTKIRTDLVRRPDIPRFRDVLPVLLAFVRSRQVPGKPVLWVGHKAQTFDGPFLAQEFGRCSEQIPADWLFVDSLCLAHKLVKIDGTKRPVNLKALKEHYDIHVEGPAHRAMQDVETLCQVFQQITLGLKLTNEGLISEAISASELRKGSKSQI